MNGHYFSKIFNTINNSLFKVIRQKGLGKTIFLWFLTLSLVPLLAASIISYMTASKVLRQDAVQSLNSISRLKTEYINSFFNGGINDLQLISELSSCVNGVKDILLNYKTSGTSLKEFVQTFDYSGYTIDIRLDLENFQRTYNYEDIYLLDLNGNILFSLNDENAVGENVFTETYAGSLFAKTCQKALKTEKPLFSDLEFFGPKKDRLAGFLVRSIKEAKIPVGIIAILVPMEKINQIMQINTETNKTGETYLIGKDLLMRSGSPLEKESTVLKVKVDTLGARQWLQQLSRETNTPQLQTEISSYSNYRHKSVLGVNYNLSSLKNLGVDWGLIAEIEEDEAFKSAKFLRWLAFGIVLGTILLVSLIAIIVSRRIVEPIRQLSSWAQRVAIGDLSYEQITSVKNEIGEMNSSFKRVVDSFQSVTDVCETIALGDFSKTVAVRSEKDSLGKAVNQMKDNLVEVVRQADSISMGDYSGEVVRRSSKDMLAIALERMTLTLRDAATLAEEVSIGDYSLQMEIKGEKDMLGRAMNQMIERLKESNFDSQRKIEYLNNIPTPVHVVDNDFNVQFINHAGATLVGHTVEECIGKKCYALFNTSHCRTDKCRSYRAMNQDKVLTGEMTTAVPGKDVPMRYTSAPLKGLDGAIIGAIEYMVDISDEMQVVELAEKISRGDYSVKVDKRSDDDRLTEALNLMTHSLRDAVEQSARQNWFKTGQTELNNRMRGELGIPELSRNIISFLTSYLDAQLGLLYFLTEDNVLQLVGSYAVGKEKAMLKKFKFGEGIVGQAALENRMIFITDIPPDYIKIKTGFGDIHPHNAMMIPFSYENNVIGVIEIASIHTITLLQKDFLAQSLENIGIALNSAESRRQLNDLLQKTQEQAEKLQAQQEELRQSNEELEGQTKALIASETNLQSQQEELRVINEELEERTRALEKQKTDVQQKNKELLHARNEIAKKARDLEEVSKYKSEFLANMSHELRTPLNSILILSQLLSNNPDKNLSIKQVEFSKTIHSSGSDLLALINEILDLSKIEAGMMEIRIDKTLMEEFVGNINRVFKPVANNKGLDFILDIRQNELPEYFYTDTQRAQQIIKNLLSNAFKFTDEGSITLIAFRPPAETDLTQSGLKPDEAIAFSVKDSGIGIPKDKQNIIFEAFRQEDGTTSRKYGGTGLGLSISRELAILLGGEIKMESERGKGSTFTLFLPEKLESPGKRSSLDRYKRLAPAEHANDAAPNATATNGTETTDMESSSTAAQSLIDGLLDREVLDDRRNLKPEDKLLLIVEDDRTFSEVVMGLARERGFKIIIAEDGETGLHFADFYKPSAIILDVNLPGINGWEVMERLKHNPDTRHIPVHFISAGDNSKDALQMGAIGYLLKPVSMSSIDDAFSKIEKVLSKPVKKLLLVDNDEKERKSIIELMGTGDISTVCAYSGSEAIELLKHEDFDAIILNPNLLDMPGFNLLEKIEPRADDSHIPVIVYSEKELSIQDQETIKKYSEKITIKDVQTPDRLFAEATLFLHRVESDMPESKQRLLNRMVTKEDVLKGKRILVVDDDMRNVFALTSILEESGLNTIVGKNGKEGIEKLQAEGDIDLILMDIMMPVMDGYEAIRFIRNDKRFGKIPIIALTAKAMKGDRSKCVAAGASDYLAKPVDGAKLLSLLRVWLYQAR